MRNKDQSGDKDSSNIELDGRESPDVIKAVQVGHVLKSVAVVFKNYIFN